MWHDEAMPQSGLSWRQQAGLVVTSCLSALVSLAWPSLQGLATSQQSLDLYVGLALSQGQAAYSEVFTTGGFLYHGLIGLATHLGSLLWLMVPQALATYLAALALYRVVGFATADPDLGWRQALTLVGLSTVLGLGGFYPMLFAQPFVLWGLYVLLKVMAEQLKDEWLVAYGLLVGLALFVEPVTLLFWLVAAGVFGGYNSRSIGRLRVLYQGLAGLFGLLLVAYVVGYVLWQMQMSQAYVQQTLLYPLTSLATQRGLSPVGGLWQLVAFVGLGFAGSLFLAWRSKDWPRPLLLLLGLPLALYGLVALLRQEWALSQLLPALPFGLLLAALPLSQRNEASKQDQVHLSRRKAHQRVWLSWKSLALPLLVVAASLGFVAYGWVQDQPLAAERARIAAYLARESQASQRIYVWDRSAAVYLASGRLSASQFPVATQHTAKKLHQDLLVDELLQGGASYLVVNNQLPLPSDLKAYLAEAYIVIDEGDLTQFTLYQQK